MKQLFSWLALIRKPLVKMSLQVAYWIAFWNIFEPLVITREFISAYVWASSLTTILIVSICLIPQVYRVLVGDVKPGRRHKKVQKIQTAIVPDNKPVEI